MKANVTLKIESEFVREAEILADEQDCSISAQLAAKAVEKVRERAKARLQTGYGLGWTPPESRDEIYERKCLVNTNILVDAHDRSARRNGGG